LMPPRMHQFKTTAEQFAEACGIIASDRQTAAHLRAVQCKCPDDDEAAGLDRSIEASEIGGAVGGIGQKMKCRAIVPEIEALRWIPAGDVSRDPLHLGRFVSEPCPGPLKRCFR